MERISRFRAVLPRRVIAALEFEQVLATQLGNMRLRTAPLDYVGNGVGWASARRFDPSVVDEQGRDVTMETFSRMPPGLRMFFAPKYISDWMTKMIIEGQQTSRKRKSYEQTGGVLRAFATCLTKECAWKLNWSAILMSAKLEIRQP